MEATEALTETEAIAWLQAHLSQPWSAATGAQHVSPQLLKMLPDLLPSLDPIYQQARARARIRLLARKRLGAGCAPRARL